MCMVKDTKVKTNDLVVHVDCWTSYTLCQEVKVLMEVLSNTSQYFMRANLVNQLGVYHLPCLVTTKGVVECKQEYPFPTGTTRTGESARVKENVKHIFFSKDLI